MCHVYLEENNNNIIIDLMILSENLKTNSDLMMTLCIYKITVIRTINGFENNMPWNDKYNHTVHFLYNSFSNIHYCIVDRIHIFKAM